MINLYNFIIENIYLYICIVIVFLIVATILFIIISNNNKRKQLKNDYLQAEKVNEKIESIEETPKNNELEILIQKMQEDVNVKPEEVVKRFEEEQEQKAIISYQELVDNVNNGKIEIQEDEDTGINFVEEIDPTIVVEEVEKKSSEDAITPEMVKTAIENISESSIKEEPKKFKNSDIISPIFGKMEDKFDYPKIKRNETTMDLLNTKEYNDLTEEIKKQEDFLKELIEFRNNL